jgi:cation:H+ antiporter
MIAVAFAWLPIFFGGQIGRWEGALLLGYYLVYTLYLIRVAVQHDLISSISAVMLYFVIRLTVVTLIVVAAREQRGRRASKPEQYHGHLQTANWPALM